MDGGKVLLLVAGVAAGAVGVWLLRPAEAAGGQSGGPGTTAPRSAVELVDGKYLVIHNDYGNWIYERLETGGFKVAVKEFTPLGLKSIWELQAEFQPLSLKTAKGEVIYVPYTQYSTESGSFNVTQKFFQMGDTGLVEIPMTLAPTQGR